jgi:predicted AAA+ superfamily ATPase
LAWDASRFLFRISVEIGIGLLSICCFFACVRIETDYSISYMNENRAILYIPRSLDSVLSLFLENTTLNKNVLLVEGARQVGKSSLVEHALSKSSRKSYKLNLERDSRFCSMVDGCREFSEFEQLLRDRIGFAGDTGEVLFIDEAQESRKLGAFVRFMKEDWAQASVILSGSTLARLFREDTRYPVGRVSQVLVGPFSFSEFLVALSENDLAEVIRAERSDISFQRHERLLELYDVFLKTGGLPAAVLTAAKKNDPTEILGQILSDYGRDFIRIFGETDASLVKSCLRSVANFVGGPSKNTSVWPNPTSRMNARISEVFARLEDWHLILRSDQKGLGTEASHAYLPKRYLFDTGLLRHLRESAVPGIHLLNTVDSLVRKSLGGIVENQLAVDLARDGLDLNGWKKTPSGGEIDFIVKIGMQTIPVECKAALKIDRRHWQGVLEYLAQYGQKFGVVVSLAPLFETQLATGAKILNLPVYLLEQFRRRIPTIEVL